MSVAARAVAQVTLAASLALAACGRGSQETRFAHIPVDNFGQIDSGLYRGAQPDRDGLVALHGMGVRTTLNLRGEDLDRALAPEGMEAVQLPAHISKPRDKEIAAFFKIVLDPARRPVFVHCAEGKERTGFYAALYRIEVDGWTPEKALDEMRAFGFQDHDHPEVVEFVRAYRARGFATDTR